MTQVQQQVDEMQLDALFDDECSASARAAMNEKMALDGDVRAQFEELGLLSQAIADSFEAEAALIPEARFEQIWDEIERTIDRDSRLQQAADEGGVGSRLSAAWRWMSGSLWRPTLALGGAALAAVVVMNFGTNAGSETGANNGQAIASNVGAPERGAESDAVQHATNKPEHAVAPAKGAGTQIAEASAAGSVEVTDPFPDPHEAAVEIEQIEFGGDGGRIGQIEGKSGTVTVIWVTEAAEPADSERSL